MADIAVVCARCQPPTRAHFAALAHAATLAPRVVLLMLNADDACSPANPFDNDMRLTLLRAALDDAVTVLMLRDRRYEPLRWAAAAEATLRAVAGEGAVVVLGDVDNASTSLPLPDTWQRAESDVQLAAAEAAARGALFGDDQPAWARLTAMLPAPVLTALRTCMATPALRRIAEEARFLAEYRRAWQAAPYAPVFVTVDSVATWRDQVLLIERGQLPGRGQWALPGGFIDVDETIAASCLRELREETGVVLGEDAIGERRVFDDPLRSQRGRTITHGFRFVLDALPAPPLAVGADDAVAAFWLPVRELTPQRLFDDHYFILQTFLGLD
ncbi:MAG: NUDIX domain-containing protein [Gammaproteobacteria bacterium]|nr:NUDIX domain-containing protein [Gammaproteobacteria bacterium]